jgi:hypothetical protein
MSLYKYVVPNLWEKILKDGYIRFTQSSVFNDPFEMQPYFEYVEKESNMRKEIKDWIDSDAGREILNVGLELSYMGVPATTKRSLSFERYKQIVNEGLEENKPEILEALEQGIYQFSNKDGRLTAEGRNTFLFLNKLVGILSLTEKRDNLLMWAHYANDHQGFVIEFDDTHEYFHQKPRQSMPPLKFLVAPLSTNNLSDEQWEFLEKKARALSPQIENAQSREEEEQYIGRLLKVVYSSERPNRESIDDLTPNDMLLVKSKDWEYEQEWRILRLLCDADKDEGDIHLFSFPPSCIKGIIFGCRMPNPMKKEISNFLVNDNRYSHVKRYIAVLDERQFRLNIVPDEI